LGKLLSKVAGGASEFALYEGAALRRQAQVFQGATSKLSDLFATMFTGFSRTVTSLGILGVLIFLYQHHAHVVEDLVRYRIFLRLTNRVPPLDGSEWVFVFAAILYLRHFCRKMADRFGQKEVRAPGNRGF
jgi:hypothetical protein